MAQRRTNRSIPPSEDPVLLVSRESLTREINQRLEDAEELANREVETFEEFTLLERDVTTWDEVNEEILRRRFSNSDVALKYETREVGFGGRGTLSHELEWVHRRIDGQTRKLNSVLQRLPYMTVDESVVSHAPVRTSGHGTKVFVVHGHDGEIKYQVTELIEKVTGERPVILHERADKGRTIIEKFEDHASEIGFAVIILTADDVGGLKGQEKFNSRARQNVVFEHGFFIGQLGRDKVLAFCEAGVERPSDLDGVLYKELEGNWKIELAQELREAGIAVDASNLL